MRKRASAIIVDNRGILMIHRIKNGVEYYVLPGGGVEEGETIEEAIVREIVEETSLNVKEPELLFEQVTNIHNIGEQKDFCFLIKNFSGDVKLGGPEAECMNNDNQYHLEWIELDIIKEMNNFLPSETKEKTISLIKQVNL